MSRPSGSVEADRRGIRSVGSSSDFRTRPHEPCLRCDEQDCPQPPSIRRVGRPSTGVGGRSLSRLRPSDASKKSVPVIAKEKARSHGVEFNVTACRQLFQCVPSARTPELKAWHPTSSSKLVARPLHALASPSYNTRVAVCGCVRISDDDMAKEGLAGRL